MTILIVASIVFTIITTIIQGIIGYHASKVWGLVVPIIVSVDLLQRAYSSFKPTNWGYIIIILVVINVWYCLCYLVGYYLFKRQLKDDLHK